MTFVCAATNSARVIDKTPMGFMCTPGLSRSQQRQQQPASTWLVIDSRKERASGSTQVRCPEQQRWQHRCTFFFVFFFFFPISLAFLSHLIWTYLWARGENSSRCCPGRVQNLRGFGDENVLVVGGDFGYKERASVERHIKPIKELHSQKKRKDDVYRCDV